MTSTQTTYQLTRSIPAEAPYDLIVAGGGPAGTAAAVCAARRGLKVLLAEATGCLGGMGTSGLVSSFGPVSDGERMLVGGFMKELLQTMWEREAFAPQVTQDFLHRQLNRWVPFKPEHLKRILDEFVVQAGVDLRFFTRVVEADLGPGRINGVVLSNVEGLRYVPARTFIDATGDAALAALAGVPCKVVLRDTDTVSPSTLCSLLAGMDWHDPAYGSDWRGIDEVKAKVKTSGCRRRLKRAFSRRTTASSPA
jgi:flavin-dependent dehydrogenase